MYAFGMMALLGLAVLAVAKIGNRYLRQVPGAFAFALVALGIGAAWLISFNLFSDWSIPVRDSGIAITLTGVALGGVGYFWREILGLFSGLYRKFTDEARVIEKTDRPLRRAA